MDALKSYKSKPGDPRLGDIVNKYSTGGPDFVFIGWEQDEGVSRNGGRVGAAKGPEAVLKRLGPTGALINVELKTNLTNASLMIGPQIGRGKSQEEAAEELENAVDKAMSLGQIPVVIGGGNDQSAPNGKAFLNQFGGDRGATAAIVNIDAHLDVRPLLEGKLAHSGSPFRQLMDLAPNTRLIEFASQGSACSFEHVDYVRSKDGDIVWLREAKSAPGGVVKSFEKVLQSFRDRSVFVSFDIDSICASSCPGVSAPGIRGIDAEDAMEIAFAAGAWPHTKLLDVSEFNPTIEEDRTGRLVCQLIYYFMCGVASRKQGKK